MCAYIFMSTHVITVVKPQLQKPFFPLLWLWHPKIKHSYQRLLHNSLHLRRELLLVSFEVDHLVASERLSVLTKPINSHLAGLCCRAIYDDLNIPFDPSLSDDVLLLRLNVTQQNPFPVLCETN